MESKGLPIKSLDQWDSSRDVLIGRGMVSGEIPEQAYQSEPHETPRLDIRMGYLMRFPFSLEYVCIDTQAKLTLARRIYGNPDWQSTKQDTVDLAELAGVDVPDWWRGVDAPAMAEEETLP